MINCYVDGACCGNGKPNSAGGYGVVVLDNQENIISMYQHFEKNTTNNRQEMKAILYALINYGKKFIDNKQILLTIYSDSAYAINSFTNWRINWKRNGWLKSDNRPPENLDLILAYDELIQQGYLANFVQVKGHSGNKWNELADDLATGRKTI